MTDEYIEHVDQTELGMIGVIATMLVVISWDTDGFSGIQLVTSTAITWIVAFSSGVLTLWFITRRKGE